MVYIYALPGNLSPVTPLSFWVRLKFDTLLLTWKKFEENASIGFVLSYLTQMSLKLSHIPIPGEMGIPNESCSHSGEDH